MATKAPIRPLARRILRCPPSIHAPSARRTFLKDLLPASDKPLAINVTRTLPYPRSRLYDLIVDVDSYASFLPYCQHSRVTAWTAPDPSDPVPQRQRRRWPAEGELTIGFGPVTQSYTSRISCAPGRSVEARSGRDEPAVAHVAGARDNPFRRLVTTWTVEDAPAPTSAPAAAPSWTKVDLDLSMLLVDPMVQMIMSQVADESATKMIEAFERRARELFGSGR